MHTLESLVADEHLADAGFFREIDHPAEGKIVDMRFPNRFSSDGRDDYRRPPLLGGDSVAILSEIGHGSDDFDELVESKSTTEGRRRWGERVRMTTLPCRK